MNLASVIVLIVIIALGVGFYTFQNKSTIIAPNYQQEKPTDLEKTNENKSSPISTQSQAPTKQFGNVQSGCTGKGTVNFTYSPQRLEDNEMIQPNGLMIGGHVTPIDHGYYIGKNWTIIPDPNTYHDVLSPTDGVITDIGIVGLGAGDYRLVVHHTCSFYTIYIHVKELSPRISQLAGSIPSNKNIPVKAGEVIGRANGFDFSAHNDEITLPGFIYPEHYKGESWKVHTVDAYDYFNEPLRSQLVAKLTRTTPPVGGKIDYDIDGRLVGNWFKENTNWYDGLAHKEEGYWSGHFALAYDALDPTHIIISLGNYSGEAKQFGVKGNGPDPASVSKNSGLIKYELVGFEYKIGDTGQYWNRRSYAANLKAENGNNVEGVVLVQLIEDRKLKLEIFPDKTTSEVSGFTNNAIVYER